MTEGTSPNSRSFVRRIEGYGSGKTSMWRRANFVVRFLAKFVLKEYIF